MGMMGGGLLGGLFQAGAAGSAADAQRDAAAMAMQTEMNMFNITQGNLAPYRDFGNAMLNPLQQLLTPGSSAAMLQQMPGYQFALQQGLRGVQNSAAARGLGTSGAAMKGAANFTTGLANQTYGDQVNRLMGAAGIGLNAAQGVGNAAMQAGSYMGNAQIGAGNAQAAGIIGQGNAYSNMAAMMGMGGQNYYNNYYNGIYGGGTSTDG
jgi:hypothetical protein